MPLRTLAIATALAMSGLAIADEVVWIGGPPTQPDARVVDIAGPNPSHLGPAQALSAASPGIDDADAAYSALRATLDDVRKFEQKLDGELLIMADLAGPIDAVTIVRGREDLKALYAAMAYQGFAVQRFFDDTLGTDERAVPYRAEIDGEFHIAPWWSAAALQPEREVSAYEIAEAPQRVAFEQTRAIVAKALPASILPNGPLPSGAVWVVDGQRAVVNAAGVIRVAPGRHYIHVERDGQILASDRADVGPGQRHTVELSADAASFDAWMSGLAQGQAAPLPESNHAVLDAFDGSFFVANGQGDTLRVYKVTAEQVVEVSLPKPGRSEPKKDEGSGFSFAVAVGGGWAGNQDWYYQDPANTEPTAKSVNAGTMVISIDAAYDIGMLRIGGGVHGINTFGLGHATGYAEKETRLHTYLHVAVGVRWAQLTAGYLFPHYVGLGMQVTVPVVGGLELRANALYGLAVTSVPDNSTWTGAPMVSVWGGAAYRFSF